MTLDTVIKKYEEKRNIGLTIQQYEVLKDIVRSLAFNHMAGMGSGKTFLLKFADEFIDDCRTEIFGVKKI